jgi:polyisoprenoid-binding protein YceI
MSKSLRAGPPLPDRKPRVWLLVGLGLLVVAVAGFAAAYLAFFNGSSAAPLKLSATPTSNKPLAAGSTTGTWSVAPGSVAGYRVREKLAMLPAKSDAVGRTSRVAGTLAVARMGSGLAVTAATFVADLRSLKSDQSMRDARIHTIGVQSDQYPTATFTLIKALVLPAAALRGQAVHLTARGRLTIHGTTRSVNISMTSRMNGSEVETAGSLTFPFTEFGMQPPNIGNFVSVENHATMEFDLHFRHGASTQNEALYHAITAEKAVSGSSGFPGGPPGGRPPPGQSP